MVQPAIAPAPAMPGGGNQPSTMQILTTLQNLTQVLSKQVVATQNVKVVPSGSTNGMPVKIAATATPGTLFHTASTSTIDEVWLFLTNTSATARIVTIEFGDATSPDHNISVTAPANDVVAVLTGLVLTSGLTIKAFAAAANVINMVGYVVRPGQ